MKVRVDDIPEDGLWFSFSGRDDVLSQALGNMPSASGIKIAPCINGGIRLIKTNDGISVKGVIHATLNLHCSRCLEPFDLTKDLDMDLLVRREAAGRNVDQQTEDDEVDEIVISGPELDVGEIIVQELYLEAPMKPLCTQGCPGLCPRCGALIGSCDCTRASDAPLDPRWEKLAGLVKK